MVTLDPVKQRVYEGDIICVDIDGKELSVSVETTLETLQLRTPIGVQIVELGESLDIDIDGDGVADLSLYLSDVSPTDSSLGAEIRVVKKERVSSENVVDETSIIAATDFDNTFPLYFRHNARHVHQEQKTFACGAGAFVHRHQSNRPRNEILVRQRRRIL